MKYKIELTETAKSDLRDIALYLTEASKDKSVAIGFINEFESDPALSLLENLRLETLPPHVVDIVNRAVEDLENFDYAHAKEMLESL